MNWTVKLVLALVALGLLVVGALILTRSRSVPPVVLTVRIAVAPPEQSGFVVEQCNSSKFKYLAGKQAGVNPVLAQKLSLRSKPNSPLLEAEVRLLTKEEAAKYAAGFIETLQLTCGSQAKVTLAGQTIE